METATNDEHIVERALTGDAEAFGEIVQRWERRIFALTYGMLGREEDARDATQETFLAAFRNLRGFRGEAKVSSWLHRIAVNQCITRQRRAKVRGETGLEDEAEKNAAVFALPLDASPARTAEKIERSVAVRLECSTCTGVKASSYQKLCRSSVESRSAAASSVSAASGHQAGRRAAVPARGCAGERAVALIAGTTRRRPSAAGSLRG